MAIRTSKEEKFEVAGTLEDFKLKVLNALKKGNFTSINTNHVLHQISANYKKNDSLGRNKHNTIST